MIQLPGEHEACVQPGGASRPEIYEHIESVFKWLFKGRTNSLGELKGLVTGRISTCRIKHAGYIS